MQDLTHQLEKLQDSLEGELHFNETMKRLYATDASVYREMPLAVAYPKSKTDIKKLITFATKEKTSLIPRTAGTSLAGQCVGSGIVVDVSKYFNKIIEVNKNEHWVKVEPGVVRDELNYHLNPYELYFGPNTSTANRAMIGGMVGNNSCGSYSIIYGTTRDHVMEVETILSDGTEVIFKSIGNETFQEKCQGNQLENKIYHQILNELSNPEQQEEIRKQFPKPEIHRRNTGYAVDVLLDSAPFDATKPPFNFCKLLAGSEGTLAFITAIKLNLVPTPPKKQVLVCAHFHSVNEALKAVLTVRQYTPRAIELMDKIIMDCTKENIGQQKNRFFIEGDPEALLIIEFGADTMEEVDDIADRMIAGLKIQELGYHYPKVYAPHIERVWDLRKAGLGLLSNIPGDAKPVAVIEDTAVKVEELSEYIEEFTSMMDGYGQQAVYYAHAGAGELHLRPILNLKDPKDIKLFRDIGQSSAKLVKKYRGSLSGEHGDGRVRAEFIPIMIGEKNYDLLRRIKQVWDPNNIFNPGKIVDAPPMDTSLRFESNQDTLSFETALDFSEANGILRAAEKCNGSGDCRKLALSGGTMCPSYMATRNEKDTTRARANILREYLTHSEKKNRFDHEEIMEVMDLCISCKGCKSECPSNVDMAALKAEFLHQYYQSKGIPLRAKAIAHINSINKLASNIPSVANFFMSNTFTSSIIKKVLGVAPGRAFPLLSATSLASWFSKNKERLNPRQPKSKIYFFCDEFTNYHDAEIGKKAIQLLTKLGYEVDIPAHAESGRAFISKGFLTEAKKLAVQNFKVFKDIISEETPLVGLEPSAILSFRDEYPRLVASGDRVAARELAKQVFLIDEFLANEIQKGNITKQSFCEHQKNILLHGHCHQKAISSLSPTVDILTLPKNYSVEVIPSGCCGMAGSFGYEKEHYEVSMKIGELVLFPAIRKKQQDTIIAAPGTSCRHQILDGTTVRAYHPVEILFEALAKV